MADNVIIKINGDVKDYMAKLEAVQKKTEDLNKGINKLAISSGATFAVVAAGATKAVNAFKDSLKPGIELTNILKNQGIYSTKLVEEYGNIANELKKLTGVDDKLITSGQAVIQRYIGQTKVTKELTQAVLDFAAGAKIDVATAFNLVAKSVGTSTNALSKYGIEISDGLSVQQKLQVFIASTNSKFQDQAAALKETLKPTERLSQAYGDLVDKIGEKLAPTIDGITDSLVDLGDAATDNEATSTIISAIAISIGSLSGAGLILSGAAKGIVAVAEAAEVLGVSVKLLAGATGVIGAVVAGLLTLKALSDNFAEKNKFKDVEDAQKRILENEKQLDVLRKQKSQGIANDPAINALEARNKILRQEIANTKEAEKATLAKAEASKKDAAVAKQLNELGEKKKKLDDDAKKAAEQAIKDRDALRKELIDAGKSELKALEDLRDRRLKIAGSDVNLRLNIEKDFLEKKFKLEQEAHLELLDLRKAQAEYEKKLDDEATKRLDDKLARVSKASSSPIQGLVDAYNEKDESKKIDLASGAGAGLLNAAGQGKAGAEGLVTEGIAIGIDSLAPGVGQALKPLIAQLAAQGPDAEANYAAGKDKVAAAQVKLDELNAKKAEMDADPIKNKDAEEALAKQISEAGEALSKANSELAALPVPIRETIKEFAKAIPDIIVGIAQAIPTIIEELANQAPIIVDRLIESIPRIVDALVRAAPKIIEAQVKLAPKIISTLISNIPDLVGSFIDGLINGAGDFVQALIDAINPFSGDSGGVGGFIGGVFEDVGNFLGFAEGGSASVKGVPSGFSGDRFPAWLTSDELVVKPDVARDLESFLDRQGGGGSGMGGGKVEALLARIASGLENPQEIKAPIEIDSSTIADVLLNLSRNKQRTVF